MRALAMSLQLPENYFDSYVNDTTWFLRTIHYPPLDDALLASDPDVSYRCF